MTINGLSKISDLNCQTERCLILSVLSNWHSRILALQCLHLSVVSSSFSTEICNDAVILITLPLNMFAKLSFDIQWWETREKEGGRRGQREGRGTCFLEKIEMIKEKHVTKGYWFSFRSVCVRNCVCLVAQSCPTLLWHHRLEPARLLCL